MWLTDPSYNLMKLSWEYRKCNFWAPNDNHGSSGPQKHHSILFSLLADILLNCGISFSIPSRRSCGYIHLMLTKLICIFSFALLNIMLLNTKYQCSCQGIRVRSRFWFISEGKWYLSTLFCRNCNPVSCGIDGWESCFAVITDDWWETLSFVGQNVFMLVKTFLLCIWIFGLATGWFFLLCLWEDHRILALVVCPL